MTDYDVIVVGSGFGGSGAALRLTDHARADIQWRNTASVSNTIWPSFSSS